ncbi:OTU domain-containing protein [Trichonephila clavata]|uniref:OTU domain-containing protein n=1 Tax=Trichonephila clavata TaxID=2740835 RepID=A0A8X6FAW4_TRICU|nr:OTU domain-containing protein [Trichonephila clavata]
MSTLIAPISNTGPVEIHPRPANAEQERVVRGDVEQMEHDANNSTVCQYKDYQKFSTAHDEFKTKFLENNFGAVCSVCDRLWHENNMKRLPLRAKELFLAEFPDVSFETASVCATCYLALNLMKLLYKLKNDGVKIDDDTLDSLHYNSKATLINQDPVTCVCAIHFNKLVDTIMGILQSKRHSSFERHYVNFFFKRTEFQHRGSQHAHILLWLNNAPEDAINGDQNFAIYLIDSLVSVSKENASGHEKLQEHKHTFTCYQKIGNAANQKCRFGAPFMSS